VNSGPPPQDNFSVFQERYAAPHSDVALRTEPEVFEAVDFGPSAVGADRSPGDMATVAGFREVRVEDVTDTFLTTCERFISVRLSYEARLRKLKGDQAFEEEQDESEVKRRAILSGLLKRSLVVARR
jgi:hypothetical protein